ncbi:MAG: hypothetical protein K6E13_09090 [Lachnospiraceae bacterium]|nr:hypothetical protein [Lachnospiraceae bacterium]
MNEKRNGITLLPLLGYIICIIAGLALLMYESFELKYISIGLFVALMISGVIAIVLYFTRNAYKRVMDYSFSAGVLMITLGCCILARLDDVTGQMNGILGVVILTLAVVVLQNSIQLKILNSKIWIPSLAVSIALIVANLVLIMQPSFIKSFADKMLSVMLVITGILGLVFMLLVKLEIHLDGKREEKADKLKAEEEEKAFQEKNDTSSVWTEESTAESVSNDVTLNESYSGESKPEVSVSEETTTFDKTETTEGYKFDE